MNRQVKAIIRWIPADRGGRTSPPPNADGYSSPAYFESDPEQTKGTWSIRLSETTSLRGSECIMVSMQFLVPDAPQELLQEGERFELREGRKVVAKGVVLPRRIDVPTQVNDFELALLG